MIVTLHHLLIAAAFCGLQSSVFARALPVDSGVIGDGCNGAACLDSVEKRETPVTYNANVDLEHSNQLLPRAGPVGGGKPGGKPTDDPVQGASGAKPPPANPPATGANIILTPDKYEERGLTMQREYQDNLGKTTDRKAEPYTNGYKIAQEGNFAKDKEDLDPAVVKALKLDVDQTFTSVEIKNNGPDSGSQGVVLAMGFSHNREDIVVSQSWGSADKLPKEDQNKLFWSDLFKQMVTLKVGAGKEGNIKRIIRSNIKNKGTQSMITLSHTENKIPNGGHGEFKVTDTGLKKKAFDRLSGLDNVRGIYRSLGEYHVAFGNLKIVKIETFATSPGREYPNLVVYLGH